MPQKSIENYLLFCQEKGIDPYRKIKSSFSIKVSPDTHYKIFLKAKKLGISFNQYVKDIIEKEITKNS